MAYDPKALQALCAQAAPPDLELTFKPMFGGIMAYAGGKVFASLSDVGLALKLAGKDRDDLLAAPGAKPLQYDPGQPPSKSYVVVPEPLLSDPLALRPLIVRSVDGLSGKAAETNKAAPRKR